MNWFKKAQLNKLSQARKKITQEIIDRVIYLRKNTNLTIKQIGEDVGLTVVPISNILRDAGLSRPRTTEDQIKEMIYYYTNGVPALELAEAYNLSLTMIISILKKHNVYDLSRRNETMKSKISDKNKGKTKEIIDKYKAGYGIDSLHNEYGESRTAIRHLLKDNGIHIRNFEEQMQTDISRQRMREVSNRNWADEAKREEILKKLRENAQSDEVREKMRQTMLRRMEEDPSIKEKLQQQARELWEDPKMREHLTDSRRKTHTTDEFRNNMSEIMKERYRNNPQLVEEMSERSIQTWKDKGGLAGLLTSYPSRQQAIDYLTNFIGNKIQSEGKTRQLYLTYEKYLKIINDHTYPDEVQQNQIVNSGNF